MQLRQLVSGLEILSSQGDLAVDVTGVEYDSRQVKPGSVFVAIRGAQADGIRFVPQALANGAAAVIAASPPLDEKTVWVEVGDDRDALAQVAAAFYGHPTRSLQLVGVTGTNGKTTTTYLIEAVLKAAGLPASVFGTIEYRGPGFAFEAARTTPEAPDLERLFRRVVDSGWKHSVMEVSSHAIELKRVAGLHFDVAVFTNLTREHLDFHGDMRSYFLAKKKLFAGMGGGMPRVMVLNSDDDSYAELRAIAPERVLSYGMKTASDIRPLSYRFGWEGTEAVFASPLGELKVSSRLMGTPNLYNMGAAIGVAAGLGISPDAVCSGLASLPNVPGRFDPVYVGQDFRVIVDYAHTGDALENVLRFAREITTGKLIVVFGCGGDRDRTKRPVMGQIAARDADRVFVTSDNPRSEDPLSIIGDIVRGLKPGGYEIIPDRREAIRAALQAATPGDTVVIAGKGHETYQIIGDQTFPFDDKAVAREILHELDAGRNQ